MNLNSPHRQHRASAIISHDVISPAACPGSSPSCAGHVYLLVVACPSGSLGPGNGTYSTLPKSILSSSMVVNNEFSLVLGLQFQSSS